MTAVSIFTASAKNKQEENASTPAKLAASEGNSASSQPNPSITSDGFNRLVGEWANDSTGDTIAIKTNHDFLDGRSGSGRIFATGTMELITSYPMRLAVAITTFLF